MAAIAYLFFLTIPFALAGTYFPLHRNGLPSWRQPNFLYQRASSAMSLQAFIDACRSRHHYTSTLECYLELENIYRRLREDPKPSSEKQALKASTRNPIPGISNENSKQIDKPESYINAILDEDKRDASNFNNVLNSTWIEIKDPRKADTPINSEIADAKETEEFVAFSKEDTEVGEKTDASIAEEKGNKTNSRATDGSNIDGETTTDVQQTKTTETSDGLIEESPTVTGETGDITLSEGVIGGKITPNQDHIISGEIDEEKQGNINVQEKTTGASSSVNTEKSTIIDLQTDSANFEFNVTVENTRTNETDIEVTTVNETDIEVTTVNKTDIEVTTEKGTEDGSSTAEQNLSTEIRSTLTSMVSEDLSSDTTLATDDFTTSTVFITTQSKYTTKSESVSVSDVDISTSSETKSATSSSTVVFPSVSVTGHTTESSDGDFTSTMVTDSKTSNSHYVTKSIPVVPEHTINIRSIKIAKVVLSVLLLVTGLIAVVMLAVYLFRVRRGAVQYDQLTLLP